MIDGRTGKGEMETIKQMSQPRFTIAGAEIVANEAGRNCNAPAVTVLITLYNYAAYIEGCLDSVRASHVEDLPGGFEVVVVDDASTDNSAALVEKYLQTHSMPVCLIKKTVNAGVADARNLGLLAARAPLVFILDADNEIRPECLAAHYQALASSDYALVYGPINRFDEMTRQSLGLMSNYDWNVRDLVSRPCVDAMAMFKKEAVLSVGGYSTEYQMILRPGWEDYDLCLKLAQAGYAGKKLPQVLSDYRSHSQSMIRSTKPFQRELAAYFCRKFFALVQQHHDLPDFFGVSWKELAIINDSGAELGTPPQVKTTKFIHRLLGEKMSRSICKRFAAAYCWLHP